MIFEKLVFKKFHVLEILKSEKLLKKVSENKKIVPKKPIERVVKENFKVENQYCFTDRILKIAYDINIDIHHRKHAKSIKSFTSQFNNIGIDRFQISKILIGVSNM